MQTRGAFTLVEIIASLLLFAMGTMAIVGVVLYGIGMADRAQAEATAWATAMSVLKDPMPMGGDSDNDSGALALWTWTKTGTCNIATDASGQKAWQYTAWPLTQGDVLVPDMREPQAGNPAVFPTGGNPISGCARGWLNGFYVERREQSRSADRIGSAARIVETRVDVYWASYSAGADEQPLASVVDRIVRQGNP